MPRDDVAQGAGERRAERQKDEPVESFAGWPGDDQNACESDTDREPASPSDLFAEQKRRHRRDEDRAGESDRERVGERQEAQAADAQQNGSASRREKARQSV